MGDESVFQLGKGGEDTVFVVIFIGPTAQFGIQGQGFVELGAQGRMLHDGVGGVVSDTLVGIIFIGECFKARQAAEAG